MNMESIHYFLFDIQYSNTSPIAPGAISKKY